MKAKFLSLSLISALLALAAVCALLASCSSSDRTVWLRYKDAEISEASYRFWLATTKLYAVSSGVSDTEEGWNEMHTDEEGNRFTTAEYIESRAREYAVRTAVKLQLFEDYGLTVSKDETERNEEYLNKLIYEKYDDSKSKFNAELKNVYGITLDDLEETLTIESKAAAVDDYLFGENGSMAPTKQDKESYYNDHYVRLQIVAINLEKEYVRNEDGSFQTDESGNYVVKVYTDEERAVKRETADAVYQLAAEGGDFTDLVGRYSEQVNKQHADGVYFLKDSMTTFADSNGIAREDVQAMFTQEPGSVSRYETEGKAIYIVKRLPLAEGAWASEAESDQFSDFEESVKTLKMNAFYDPLAAEVLVSDELYALRVADIRKGIL